MRHTITAAVVIVASTIATAPFAADAYLSMGPTSIRPASSQQIGIATPAMSDLGRSFRYAGPVVSGPPAASSERVSRLALSVDADAPPAPPAPASSSPVKIVQATNKTASGHASAPRVPSRAYSSPAPARPVQYSPRMLSGGATTSTIVATESEKVYDNATSKGTYWTDTHGDDACCANCCCQPCWHRSGAFFDFLYLHASGVDVSYALPQDGINTGSPATGTAPMGVVGVADPDYEGGARAGFTYALDCCSSLTGTYTWYESDTTHGISAAPPIVVRSLLHPPSVVTTLEGYGNAAVARYDIDFDLFDLDYRRLYSGSKCHAVNYLIGVRYAYLNQELTMDVAAATTSRVTTDVDFEGLGFRFGVDGERHAACSGLFVYGRGVANLLAGEVRADYLLQNTAPATLVDVTWEDDRVVPVLEYELGAGWQNACGTLRLSAGYYMAAWFNTVSTGTWVQAVQGTNFVNVDDTLTFDGLTARVEVRW